MSIQPFSTIEQLEKKLKTKEISSKEILQFYLRRFEAFDGQIGSALEVFDADSIKNYDEQSGLLSGIPGLIKDNICQQGRRLTCASKILENYVATYNSTAVDRLQKHGALLVGRANMDEFAMGSSTETSAYQKTKNPWDYTRVPGGSSGGSAAAVAAGLVPWSLGSETGGSVRQPAAFCGITGLKPTYGLVSRYGLVAYGSSVDQIGIFSHTVYDNAKVLSVIAGHDLKDSSSLRVGQKDYTARLHDPIDQSLTIGIVEDALYSNGMDPEVVSAIEESIKIFESFGIKTKRVSLPTMEYAAAAYFILSRAEAASNLARFDGVRYGLRDKTADNLKDMYFNTRHDGFGQEIKARIMVGNYVLSSGHEGEYYQNAKKVQRVIRREFINVFKDVNLLLMPTHPAPAFKFGAFEHDKLQMDLQDYFTCSMNLAGIPAISIPCGMSSQNLPIGLQLVGPHLGEELLFKVGQKYQLVTDWHKKHPSHLQ